MLSRMQKIKTVLMRALAPVTIMLIPHHNTRRSFHLSIPVVGVFISAVIACCGAVYLGMIAIDAIKYRAMEKQIEDYAKKVSDFNTTLASLKKAEKDLYKLLSLGSRDKVLENVDVSDMGNMDMGTVDIQQVQQQIAISVKTVGAIKEYLNAQKNLYMATPKGLPVPGTVSSPFGSRVNPISGRVELHRGIDVSIPAGTPVLATADGIVSFSGWNGGGGNVVVIEHGHGFSTYYAHNESTAVEVGQQVKRGEVVAHAGSTGSSTGSHVHYEVWQTGRVLNPRDFIERRS
jgi:murein DD-endopeptidase MepM/ murein hydrolase activator NlpD